MRIKNTYKNDQVDKVDICKCGKTTLEQIINDLNCDSSFAIKNHIKKGGYHNQKLQLENYKLNEENDYLKKLNDFNTTQLGYYTKKYHSWYDDYENY